MSLRNLVKSLFALIVVVATLVVPLTVASGATVTQPQLLRPAGIPEVGSLNWSGYAVTSATTRFTYVHSEWVQPSVTCYGVKDQVTSNWVGLDGDQDGTVEQDGTGAACKGPNHETPIYYAWVEMYPANSVTVFPVTPGDLIDASVSYANKIFSLTVSDLTSGRTKTVTAGCAGCKRSSAEWIIERPASCKNVDPYSDCYIDALANFGSTTMTENTAQVAGGPVSAISAFPRARIVIVDPEPAGVVPLDDVSSLGGGSFTVTWLAAGKPVPITL